jgi:hypothetical protein
MVDFILLFVSLLFICSIKAQINLNRSNLAKVCNCNIFDSQIILDNKNISTIVENKFIGLTNLTKFELIQDYTFKDLSSLKTLDIQLNRIESI